MALRIGVVSFAMLAGPCQAAYDCAFLPLGGKANTTAADVTCDGDKYGGNVGTCTWDKCCQADATLCGGQSTPITCDAGEAVNDKNKVGTDKAKCCTAKAACTADTPCRPGYSVKETLTDLYCSGATCVGPNPSASELGNTDDCCEQDTKKCKSFERATGCGAGKGLPKEKYDTEGDDADTCCIDELKCSDYTCSSYTDPVSGTSYEVQDGDAKATGTYLDADAAPWSCCKLAEKYCATVQDTVASTCAAGTYFNQNAVGETKADCCVDTPTCADYVMPAAGVLISSGRQSASIGFLTLLGLLTQSGN